jgi:hypothetical protein
MYGGMDVWIHTFLTLALFEGEWSASHPYCFISKERSLGTHWMQDRTDCTDDWGNENYWPYQDSNSNCSVIQPLSQSPYRNYRVYAKWKFLFFCMFSCYLLLRNCGLRCLCSCSYADTGYQVIKDSSIRLNRVFPTPLHLRTETNPVSETLHSLVFFRIPDDKVQKPSIPKCDRPLSEPFWT